MTANVLTANRLEDGVSVWLNANGQWDTSIADSLVARHAEAIEALNAIGAAAMADNRVVDATVIGVEETPHGPRALRLRERIRAEGPTIDYAPAAVTASQAA